MKGFEGLEDLGGTGLREGLMPLRHLGSAKSQLLRGLGAQQPLVGVAADIFWHMPPKPAPIPYIP